MEEVAGWLKEDFSGGTGRWGPMGASVERQRSSGKLPDL